MKLITGEKILYSEWKKFSPEQKNLLRKRAITPLLFGQGRKAVDAKYSLGDLGEKESFEFLPAEQQDELNEAFENCAADYVFDELRRVKDGSPKRRENLMKMGLILCVGNEVLKKHPELQG